MLLGPLSPPTREWKQVYADSQKDGSLTSKIENIFLNATDYSPKLDLRSAAAPPAISSCALTPRTLANLRTSTPASANTPLGSSPVLA